MKISQQNKKKKSPNLPIFSKKCMARGKLGVQYLYKFAICISMKCCRFTKIPHDKFNYGGDFFICSYCVTSVKGPLLTHKGK